MQPGGTAPTADPARARPRPCVHLLPVRACSTARRNPDSRYLTGIGALAHQLRELLFRINEVVGLALWWRLPYRAPGSSSPGLRRVTGTRKRFPRIRVTIPWRRYSPPTLLCAAATASPSTRAPLSNARFDRASSNLSQPTTPRRHSSCPSSLPTHSAPSFSRNGALFRKTGTMRRSALKTTRASVRGRETNVPIIVFRSTLPSPH